MSEITVHPTFIQCDSTFSFFAFDPYIERFWLRALGPTATLLLNELTIRALISTSTQQLPVIELSRTLGIGARIGKSSPIYKQLNRLTNIGMLIANDKGEYLVPRTIKPLPDYILNKLDNEVKVDHAGWMDRLAISPLSTQRKRIRYLLNLLDSMGVSRAIQNDILGTCGLHPSIIGEFVQNTISPRLTSVANL